MKGKKYVGIDIGGTKVNIGVIDENGTIITSKKIRTDISNSIERFVKAVCEELSELLLNEQLRLEDIEQIGIGIPGTANREQGVIEYSSNLFGSNIPIGKYFEERLERKIALVQDSWAAAWGEHLFGAGRNRDDFLCITLGTGIGCGVIMKGKVYAGAMNTAGEIGHVPIIKEGRKCSCGKYGCLERYASGTGILEQAMELFPGKLKREKKAEKVFELAYKGDQDALQLIHACVDKLAYGLAIIVNILSIDTIVISGGLCVHEELIIKPLPELIMKYGYDAWSCKKSIRVIKAELGSYAPMIGAAFINSDCFV